jgi:tRNA threonylcarbamoyladenosine modification (KEOPS) complex  Pcc1 subunit
MNYKAEIKVYGDPEKISKCFEPETNEKNRANFSLKKEKDHVLFEINAKDSVALRATLNSITKLLTTYEKVENI